MLKAGEEDSVVSTVSNAAVRSGIIRMTESPASVANRISLKTLSDAVAVLSRALKPDWNT